MDQIRKFIIVISIIFVSGKNVCGQNEFTIGMFCFEWNVNSNNEIHVSRFLNSKNSSSLNVLAEDGFNLVQEYRPDWWSSINYTTRLVSLAKNNGLKILVNSMHFYWPNNPNEYDNTTGARPNYFYLIDNIYSSPSLQNTVWGHQITEEASYFQLFNPSNNPPRAYGEPYLKNFEVPTSNVNLAIKDFRERLNLRNVGYQKLVMMEAAHHKAIGDLAPYDKEGNYIPSDYLKIKNKPDVFFEGSYKDFVYPYIPQDYRNIQKGESHYLGFLKSIDYAYQYVDNVHKVMNIEGAYKNVLHYNTAIPNANWLWFQSYASIIHGAKGLWFFQLNKSWQPDEKPEGWDKQINRFDRENFSTYYRDYVAYLAQELSHLKNENLLQAADSSVICSKTDHVDNFDVLPQNKLHLPSEYRSNDYDLRYTFRTNGEEALLIIVNPLPFHIDVVDIDLTKIPNHIVRHTDDLELLFNNSNLIYHSKYKIDRNSNILNTNQGELKKMNLEIDPCSKKFKLHFGPMDAHIVKLGKTNLNGWQENATAGYFAKENSALAVEDFKTNQRKFFYIDEEHYIRITYKTEHSWKNTTLKDVPKARSNSPILLNANGDAFFISENHQVIKLSWEEDYWIFQKLSDFQIPAIAKFTIDHLDKVYTLNERNQLVIIYNLNSIWETATLDLLPKAFDNTNFYWNRQNDELYYISEEGVICAAYWDNNFWNFEKTSGTLANPESKIFFKDHKVFYVGQDGIIRFTYRSSKGREWKNSWFSDFPEAKLNSDIQWNDDDNGIVYISKDNKIRCIFWDGKWNHKVLSNECDELAANNLIYFNHRIGYLGLDGKIHEYTNYDKLPHGRNMLSTKSNFNENIKKRKELDMYPNPARDYIYFDCRNPNAAVLIKNQLGKILFDGSLEDNYLNLSALPRGLFFVTIKDEEEFYIQKLILN